MNKLVWHDRRVCVSLCCGNQLAPIRQPKRIGNNSTPMTLLHKYIRCWCVSLPVPNLCRSTVVYCFPLVVSWQRHLKTQSNLHREIGHFLLLLKWMSCDSYNSTGNYWAKFHQVTNQMTKSFHSLSISHYSSHLW